MSDKLHQLEPAINKISEVLLAKPGSIPTHARERSEQSANWQAREHSNGGRPMFSSRVANLEFPKYACDDLTEWLTRVEQFFNY